MTWLPGFTSVEGPVYGQSVLRYRAVRESDGAPAWVRVDAHAPDDVRAARSLGRIYAATAAFDSPDLPPVLAYGPTEIAGRPFIAFRLSRSESGSPPVDHSDSPFREVLAELQLVAYENGLLGIHLPAEELERTRSGERAVDRRLPAREFVAEPRRPDGRSVLWGALPDDEWHPFTAPELLDGKPARNLSVRQALAYRVGAHLHYLRTGERPGPSADGVHADPALDVHAARRPPLETLIA